MGEEKFLKAGVFVHPTAIVSPKAKIGAGTKIWAFAQIREGAKVGGGCMIGNGVYIDKGVRIGARVNVHNKSLLYRNLLVEDDVFIGPGVCFTNDPLPRANVIRNLKGRKWRVRRGASIGAGVFVLSDVSIGRFAMVGAGAVVSKDVPDYGLVYGAPARLVGFVSPKGNRLEKAGESQAKVFLKDPKTSFELVLKREIYESLTDGSKAFYPSVARR